LDALEELPLPRAPGVLRTDAHGPAPANPGTGDWGLFAIDALRLTRHPSWGCVPEAMGAIIARTAHHLEGGYPCEFSSGWLRRWQVP
jgi:hypothetical protein